MADLDRDGDLDVIAGNYNQANRVYLNNGTADPFSGVTGSDLTADAQSTTALEVADLDADGDLDVIAGNNNQANRVYLNNGTADPFGGVTGSDLTADAHGTRDLAVADLDGDGDWDVIAGNTNQANRVYLNNGTADPFGGITGSDLTADIHETYALAVGDLDDDGALDIVAGNYGQPNRIYRRIKYNTGGQRVVSVSEVSSETGTATLSAPLVFAAESDLPLGTSIDYYLSNDGGLRWLKVRSGKLVNLPSGGSELKWRAELQSLSPMVTPVLHSVFVKYAPQVADAPILDVEADPALSSAEAADGTVVTVPIDGRYVLTGDIVAVFWGAAGAATGAVAAADVINQSVGILIDAATLQSQGEGAIAVTATVTDAYANTSAASPAVVATVDFTAPGAPQTPALPAEATDGVLDAIEALNGTPVSVGLAGAGAVTGDSVTVVWNGALTTKLISSGDVAAKSVVVTVPATAIGAVQLQSINVYAYLTDRAGNLSGNSLSAAATVSTDGGDQDHDGLQDSNEVLLGTNPTVGDTDGDGLADGLEAVLGSDPALADTDGDGLPDGWEFENGTDMVVADDTTDPDGDGLTNAQEQELGTKPLSADSDNDGLPDAYEVEIGSDPTAADSDKDADGDGVNNLEQFYAGNVSAPVDRADTKRETAGSGCSSSGQGNMGSGLVVAASLMFFRLRRRVIG